MSHMLGVFFDIVIIAALVATILHARKLSKQFDQMQADRKAFDQLIQAMNLASSRAEAAIRSLKESAADHGDRLQEKINKALEIEGELEIMIQAGDSLADRLQGAAETARKNAQQETSEATRSARDTYDAQPRTKAEKDLLDALKAKQKT